MRRFSQTLKGRYPSPVFAIVLTGLLLRLYDLGTESLWRDEIISIQVAQLDPSQIGDNRAANFHPPLYYFLLHYWLKLLGSSAFAARLLSALCGTVAILLFYRIGAYLFSERLGLLGALIFALAEFQVHYAQEVKGYALFALLDLCSFYFLLVFLQQRSLRGVSGYVLSTALLLYTHVYGLFSLAAQNLYVLSTYFFSHRVNKTDKSKIILWLSVQGLLLLLFLPWLGVLVDQVNHIQRGYWITSPTLSSLVTTFSAYSGSDLSLVLFLLTIALPVILRSRIENSAEGHPPSPERPLLLIGLWLATPILVPFILSQFIQPIYLTRGTIGASCAFYLMLAKGADSLREYKFAWLFLVGLMSVFSVVNVFQYYAKPTRQQWREVAGTVDGQARATDMILFYPDSCQGPFEYYSQRPTVVRRSLSTYLERGRAERTGRSTLPRIWLVACDGYQPGEPVLKRTEGQYQRVFYEDYFGGIKLSLFTSKDTD